MTELGLRYNSGKLPLNLISDDAMEELAKVLSVGAEKYAPRNWQKGLKWDECYGSLLRHAAAWHRGEERDAETGQLHIAHVLCNAMFLTHFYVNQIGEDDRPHGKDKVAFIQKGPTHPTAITAADAWIYRHTEERDKKVTQPKPYPVYCNPPSWSYTGAGQIYARDDGTVSYTPPDVAR